MNPLKKIFGSGIKEAAEGVGSLALNIREAIKGKETDPNKRLELIAKAAEVQAKVNAIEAQHPKVFVSGWRPFAGWMAGVGLGVYYIPQYAVAAYLWAKMCLEQNALLPYPIDSGELRELLIAMLGLGIARSIDKFNKVDSK